MMVKMSIWTMVLMAGMNWIHVATADRTLFVYSG